MNKIDIYILRAIIQEIKNVDLNDRDPMQKDKKRELLETAISICNDYIDNMQPIKNGNYDIYRR